MKIKNTEISGLKHTVEPGFCSITEGGGSNPGIHVVFYEQDGTKPIIALALGYTDAKNLRDALNKALNNPQ